MEQEHNAFFLTNAWHIWRIWDHYDSNISTLDAIKLVYNASKINKEEIHFYILPGEKELIGETTYWKVKPYGSSTFSRDNNG